MSLWLHAQIYTGDLFKIFLLTSFFLIYPFFIRVEDSFDNIDDNIDELESTLASEEKNFRQEKVLSQFFF